VADSRIQKIPLPTTGSSAADVIQVHVDVNPKVRKTNSEAADAYDGFFVKFPNGGVLPVCALEFLSIAA
jgi:hypothetical protein